MTVVFLGLRFRGQFGSLVALAVLSKEALQQEVKWSGLSSLWFALLFITTSCTVILNASLSAMQKTIKK